MKLPPSHQNNIELLRRLESEWPRFWRGRILLLGEDLVAPGMTAVLARIDETSDPSWIRVLLGLAWQARGQLRRSLLTCIERLFSQLRAEQWVGLDESFRSGYRGATWPGWLRSTWYPDKCGLNDAMQNGLDAWNAAVSFHELRARLGSEDRVAVLASMHAKGNIRQDAVSALEYSPSGICALLIRVNDWVAPVRGDALISVHRLIATGEADPWIVALPLVVRLESCGRGDHTGLIDKVGALFLPETGRRILFEAVRHADGSVVRAAAAMAFRVYGPSDAELQRVLLTAADSGIRLRSLRALSADMDDELLELLLRDPLASVRLLGLDILGQRGGVDARSRFREACFDTNANMRHVARFHLERRGELDTEELLGEARTRVGRAAHEIPGALACLLDIGGPSDEPLVAPLVRHRRAAVRLLAKRCLIAWLECEELAARDLDEDPSAKVARHVVGLLRARGVRPEAAEIWRRVQASADADQAAAWLDVLARCGLWQALPYLVRALSEPRAKVANRAQERLETVQKRQFPGYQQPPRSLLADLAQAVKACPNPHVAPLKAWVAATTGQADWLD